MRFVAVKTVEQQALLSLHRARALLVRQRTQLINGLRGMVAEFDIYIAKGLARVIGGHQFRNDREFAAWLGLTPANKSSGGKEKLGRITIPFGTSLLNALPGSEWVINTYDYCWSLA